MKLDDSNLITTLDEATDVMKAFLQDRRPHLGIILGSGLGGLAERLTNPIHFSYESVPGMSPCSATGHKGNWVSGQLHDEEVLIMQGRYHGYEGYTPAQVAFPVWLMARLGLTHLITTNAAGAINESFQVGDFCVMNDHINATGRNPIVGMAPNYLAPRFFSMYEAYDPTLRNMALATAQALGIPMHEGVYLGLLGPSFETPAEIRTFRRWGADTVAMSVVEEVIAARHVGLSVLGISLITNMACGIDEASPSDQEVHEVASKRSEDFFRLMAAIVQSIGSHE